MTKKLLGILFASVLLLGSQAGAGVLVYGGQLSVSLATLPGLAVPGGGAALVNGSGGGTHLTSMSLSGGAFGPVGASLAVTANATVASVRFTSVANASGAFAGGTGANPLGGLMGLTGSARICLFASTCPAAVVVPLTGGLGAGPATQTLPGFIALTLQHQAWTQGFATVTIHDAATTTGAVTTPPSQHAANTNTLVVIPGFAHGAASATSSTAAGSGTIQLVTITKVFTSLSAAFPELPLIGVLTLQFVPEPGTLFLTGAGMLGLLLLGRKSRR